MNIELLNCIKITFRILQNEIADEVTMMVHSKNDLNMAKKPL